MSEQEAAQGLTNDRALGDNLTRDNLSESLPQIIRALERVEYGEVRIIKQAGRIVRVRTMEDERVG